MTPQYRDTTVALQHTTPESKSLCGFPFLLIARWLVATVLIASGVFRMIDLAQGWSWLADRTIIDAGYSPFIRLVADCCVLLTGVLLLRRSIFVFIPLLGHCAIFLWLVFGFAPMQKIPGSIFVMWAVQSGLLGFVLWLLIKRRLR